MTASSAADHPAAGASRPRVYLNSIEVRSRAEPELLQTFYNADCSRLAGTIRERLASLINLPHVSTVDRARVSDLALDILVPDFVTAVPVYDMRLRLFHFDPGWCPTLTVAARLNNLISGATVEQLSVTRTTDSDLRWRDLLSMKALLEDRSADQAAKLDQLLSQASLEIVARLRQSIRFPATARNANVQRP